MSSHTDPNLENQMMYSVFVRNHSEEGTFDALAADLDRIRDLGTDILWLMPLGPTGLKDRKGKDGSPYAIKNYREIEPSYGGWDGLKRLVEKAHEKGMKVIVDVVFNHTSPDSFLFETHPEWFYLDEQGKPASLVEDWSDIIDLDYANSDLQEELIATLKQYAAVIDGFRCDVASRIPVSFWKKARAACEEVHPGMIWLAESCHLPFIKFVRDHGRIGESDYALYEAFDVLYDYDTFPDLQEVFEHERPLKAWVDALICQEASLPVNAIKLRYLENHDTDRIAKYVKDPLLWRNWTAMLFTLKGLPLIYHGQEVKESHRPDIFTKDPVDFSELKNPDGQDSSAWIANLTRIHRELFSPLSVIEYDADDEQHLLTIDRDGCKALFLLQDPQSETLRVTLDDGEYENLFDDRRVSVSEGHVSKESLPLLIRMDD